VSGVLVIAEHRHGALRACTREALGAALAHGSDVTTVVLSDQPERIAAELDGVAPNLTLVEHPALADYNPEAYLPVLADLVGSLAPELVLLPHTSQGMDLGPALAGRLGLPLITDCTAISANDDGLVVRRQAYAGKIVETLVLRRADTTILTLQVGAFAEAAPGLQSVTVERTVAELSPRHDRRLLEYVRAAAGDVDIGAADILVAVGRGIGKQDNIALAQRLADTIGATLACSRPVTDAGWLPKSRQVGTSGKTVRPKLYIALGISGAFQHLAGMKGADTIIAVNKDPAAPIFKVAHYGVVADVLEVLPALAQALAR